ncbi:Crp/Fnr family transcriptional regulator [Benzoatithermus flavus]|uniref:Crp/Fnr family transcriptional regulator n=1 Tax=Benzoatithermus flavus TaxID=3108223 RepID=A0ABU8XS30_9PROT
MSKDETSARKALLSGHPLFAELRAEELEQIVRVATERCYAHGQLVFQRGDPGTSLLGVLAGRVRIGLSSEDGKEVTFGILGPGELFGEIGALDGQGRTADAVAMDGCRLLVLEHRDFLSFLERNPRCAVRLLQILCARMRKATGVCESLALLDVPVRLARLLLQLALDHGEPTGEGRRIALRLSQQELGNLIAATRESVNKHLKAWEAEGLIGMEQGRLVLNDIEAMRLLSGCLR